MFDVLIRGGAVVDGEGAMEYAADVEINGDRIAAVGSSPGDLAAMRGLVCAGMDHGAVGLSSGLGYRPGRYAEARELAELCRPVAARGLPYVTHMRVRAARPPEWPRLWP